MQSPNPILDALVAQGHDVTQFNEALRDHYIPLYMDDPRKYEELINSYDTCIKPSWVTDSLWELMNGDSNLAEQLRSSRLKRSIIDELNQLRNRSIMQTRAIAQFLPVLGGSGGPQNVTRLVAGNTLITTATRSTPSDGSKADGSPPPDVEDNITNFHVALAGFRRDLAMTSFLDGQADLCSGMILSAYIEKMRRILPILAKIPQNVVITPFPSVPVEVLEAREVIQVGATKTVGPHIFSTEILPNLTYPIIVGEGLVVDLEGQHRKIFTEVKSPEEIEHNRAMLAVTGTPYKGAKVNYVDAVGLVAVKRVIFMRYELAASTEVTNRWLFQSRARRSMSLPTQIRAGFGTEMTLLNLALQAVRDLKEMHNFIDLELARGSETTYKDLFVAAIKWGPAAQALVDREVDNIIALGPDPMDKNKKKLILEIPPASSIEACVAINAAQKTNRRERNLNPDLFHHNATMYPHSHDDANDVIKIVPSLTRFLKLLPEKSKFFIETRNNASVTRYLTENECTVMNHTGDGKFTSVLSPPNLITAEHVLLYDADSIAQEGKYHTLNILYTEQAKSAGVLIVRVDYKKLKMGVNKDWAKEIGELAQRAGYKHFAYLKGERHHTPIVHLIMFKATDKQMPSDLTILIKKVCMEAHTIAAACERLVQYGYLIGIRPDLTKLLRLLGKLYPKMVVPDPGSDKYIIVGRKATPATLEMLVDTATMGVDNADGGDYDF